MKCNTEYPYEFWVSVGRGLEFHDYSGRLIVSLNAKKPKTIFKGWSEL